MLSERYDYLARLPLPLAVKIKEAAKENRRSINAEIIIRLERSFSDWQRMGLRG